MNPWLASAAFLLLCMIGPLIACARGGAVSRLVGLETATTMAVAILLLLAIGWNRDFLIDLALAVALLSFGGAMVFARFLERWF